jgi:hypothetical protein
MKTTKTYRDLVNLTKVYGPIKRVEAVCGTVFVTYAAGTTEAEYKFQRVAKEVASKVKNFIGIEA